MTVTSNISEKIIKLEALAANGSKIDVSASLSAGVNAARGLMQNRIFNTGRDANNESFGRYTGRTSKTTGRKFRIGKYFSVETKKALKKKRKALTSHSQFSDALAFTEYEKERLSEGRQIAYKDLEFHGSLRRAIVTANDGPQKVVCLINNPIETNIARYQEQQIGKIRGSGIAKIFSLSDEERTELKNVANAALKQQYDRLLNIK